MDTAAVFPAWPGDAEVAVALTFDVDGEAAWLGEGPQNGRRLTLLSQRPSPCSPSWNSATTAA